jgi:hypothetical protein
MKSGLYFFRHPGQVTHTCGRISSTSVKPFRTDPAARVCDLPLILGLPSDPMSDCLDQNQFGIGITFSATCLGEWGCYFEGVAKVSKIAFVFD